MITSLALGALWGGLVMAVVVIAGARPAARRPARLLGTTGTTVRRPSRPRTSRWAAARRAPATRRHRRGASPVAVLLTTVVAVPARVAGGLLAHQRAGRRTTQLTNELSALVDLVAVAVAAGCTPYLALEVAAAWSPTIVSVPVRAVTRACALGARLQDALDDLARDEPVLAPLAAALSTSVRTGTPTLPALERLSAETRADVRRRAETRARTVPVRLLFPLVFLVLPAFALLTVVPSLLAGLARTQDAGRDVVVLTAPLIDNGSDPSCSEPSAPSCDVSPARRPISVRPPPSTPS